jgi:hypothetical protein
MQGLKLQKKSSKFKRKPYFKRPPQIIDLKQICVGVRKKG